MVRPTINSVKHIVQHTPAETTIGTLDSINIANVVENPQSDVAIQIGAGTTLKAVFVEMWFMTTDNQPGSANVTLEKVSSGASLMTFAEQSVLHTYKNKKNVLYTTQGLVGDANTNPMGLIRQWIAIPKGKQRFGLGDNLVLNIAAITGSVNHCGLFIYKAYT